MDGILQEGSKLRNETRSLRSYSGVEVGFVNHDQPGHSLYTGASNISIQYRLCDTITIRIEDTHDRARKQSEIICRSRDTDNHCEQ